MLTKDITRKVNYFIVVYSSSTCFFGGEGGGQKLFSSDNFSSVFIEVNWISFCVSASQGSSGVHQEKRKVPRMGIACVQCRIEKSFSRLVVAI